MDNQFEFLVYRTAEEDISINAVVKDETIWLTQKAMGELFGVDKSSISRHLKNIFAEGELQEEVVVAKFATTTPHGAIEGKTQTKDTQFYNLDAIISVGYRVNSHRATQFRIWATGVLKEYMTKGFALDDDRLKQGKTAFGKDYFRELLERVRSIRASERRIWQQITDIFADCSIDYDRNSQITHDFYAMVQNKFHYAIVGQRQHGADDMEARAGWTHFKVRCLRREKLPRGKTDPSTGARRHWLFRLHRRPDRAGKHLHNGGICRQRKRVSDLPQI